MKTSEAVAIIVEKSGDEKWNSFMNGLKQAAGIANIHLIICNTDEIENAEGREERFMISWIIRLMHLLFSGAGQGYY